MWKYKKVISSSGTNAYTGSIAKVVALGADGDEATLSHIEFGSIDYPVSSAAQPEWKPTSTITTNVQIPAGSSLDGPMGRIQVGAGGFLIYFAGPFKG